MDLDLHLICCLMGIRVPHLPKLTSQAQTQPCPSIHQPLPNFLVLVKSVPKIVFVIFSVRSMIKIEKEEFGSTEMAWRQKREKKGWRTKRCFINS